MKLTNRTARRVAAIASVISAAILIPAVALAAPGRPAHTAAATPRCSAADLRPWLGVPGEGAAGHTFYQLEISNVSHHSCSLRGFPGVSAVGPHGQLGSAAARNRSHPVRTVTLTRGATAHVELTLTNVSGFSHGACHQTTASELKVFAPNDFKANLISFSFPACAKRGPVFLGVSTVIAGTGIPFFSR